MDGPGRLLLKTQGAQSGGYNVLEVALAGVDYVENLLGPSKGGRGFAATLHRAHPNLVTARIGVEGVVKEVLPQQPELPKLVGHILADISDGAVRADDHLGVFGPGIACGLSFRRGIRRLRVSLILAHDPAARIFPLGLQVDGAALLQQSEGMVPKLKVQDLALARQQIVLHVEARHGRKMIADDCHGDDLGDARSLAVAVLDILKRLAAQFQPPGICFIKVRNAGVKVPAVIVEAHRRVGDQQHHLFGGLFFDVNETHHHVGHLDSGVINVVLHLDGVAPRAQDAHQRVAERRVAQVPDVRGFVRIDVGVLDDDLLRGSRCGLFPSFQPGGIGGPIQVNIHVARTCHLRPGNALDRPKLRRQLLGDLARGLSDLASQLHGQRKGQIAHRRARRLVCDDADLQPILPPRKVTDRLLNFGLCGEKQGSPFQSYLKNL